MSVTREGRDLARPRLKPSPRLAYSSLELNSAPASLEMIPLA